MPTSLTTPLTPGELLAIGLYFALFGALALFGFHRLVLVIHYVRTLRRRTAVTAIPEDGLPVVTVQLPVFNEMYVAERLVRAVCGFDWPRDRLEIQVLDDSTDETRALLETLVAEQRALGLDIHYLHRSDRTGFKAGALQDGLKRARGSFIAIFDADFVPEPDLLRRTIPCFSEPRIGMVQVRWEHLNRDHSLLTRLQAILLDGHFVIEHTARHRSGAFFNFNGTAGVWRRECIADAGGWEHDTLTEDLDLSYRAQLRGWRFVYLPEVTAAAELPAEMNAFKSQQHRWTKGSVQTCLKLLPAIWRAPIPLRVKLEATVHLTNNLAYLMMAVIAVLTLPTLLIRLRHRDVLPGSELDTTLLGLATVTILLFFAVSQLVVPGAPRAVSGWRRLFALPGLLALGLGLSLNNARAVLEALTGRVSEFVRTPKFGIVRKSDTWHGKKYRARRNLLPWVELAAGVYMIVTVGVALAHSMITTAVFLSLYAAGFLYVGLLSVAPHLHNRVAPAPASTSSAPAPASDSRTRAAAG